MKDEEYPVNGDGSSAGVQENGNGAKKRVLVVDDDPRILRFIRATLRLVGFDVLTTTSGEEALLLVESAKPDVILLDVLMPAIDGFEVLRRLRVTSRVPVIMASAHNSTAEEAFMLGANDFLSKPFRPDELVKKIKALCPE
jgi:DNA-binding response OmpR family regulator